MMMIHSIKTNIFLFSCVLCSFSIVMLQSLDLRNVYLEGWDPMFLLFMYRWHDTE
jgi:hypothetical protein